MKRDLQFEIHYKIAKRYSFAIDENKIKILVTSQHFTIFNYFNYINVEIMVS